MHAYTFSKYQTKGHKSNNGQHHLHVLYSQIRESEVPILVFRSPKIVELVYPIWHQHFWHILTRTPKHHSRPTEHKVLTRTQVGDRLKNHTIHSQVLGIPEYRSVLHKRRCLMPTILLKSRAGLSVSGVYLPHYGRCTPRLRLSTLSSAIQSSSEVYNRTSQSHSHSLDMVMVCPPITLQLTPHPLSQEAGQILHPNLKLLHLKA